MARVHELIRAQRRTAAALLVLAALAFAAAAALGSPATGFAHHIEYDASATCEGWQAKANFVGGENQRLVVIADVRINGVPYNPSWSAAPVVPYNPATVGAITGSPAGSQLYMWIGTSPGWNIFTRSGLGPVLAGSANWSGTIYIFRRDTTPHWEQARPPVQVYQPQQPTNCATSTPTVTASPTQPPPTATPTPAQPSTATPTHTPTQAPSTATPTPISTVAAVRTPGPQPPTAGAGLGDLSSANMLYALLGVLALSGGIAFLALGRSADEE